MRVIPEQVVLNVDPDMAVPPCPMPGHNWDTLVYKPDASWIAHWIDNVNNMGKYVGVNATSFLKGENDMEKYEVVGIFVRLISIGKKIKRSHQSYPNGSSKGSPQ